ncbi:ROK family protein [Oscillospiraceae bacterium OttesenSCG-928-F05]|nr:ROK family protein [Oscillospiraceae bacterium OttesenSCG-928-F05]
MEQFDYRNFRLGVDLGGSKIAAGVIDADYTIIGRAEAPTMPEKGFSAVADAIAGVAEMAVVNAGLDPRNFRTMGVGSPGVIDPENGVVVSAANLKWDNVPLAATLSERTGMRVTVGNDANCAALGEVLAGSAAGKSSALMITLGTGIGGGLVLDRKIYAGFNGAAGEVGHVIISVDGRLCGCGRKGCWESYASVTGLLRTTREVMEKYPESILWNMVSGDLSKLNGLTPFDAMRANDPAAREIVSLYIKHLAAGLIGLISILQPEMVCIGGGISNEREYLLDPLQRLVDEANFMPSVPQPVITRALLGNDAGIIGAAAL